MVSPGDEKGFAPGQVNLGALYVEGQGVEKNDAEVLKWFRKAAEQASMTANTSLA